MGSEPKPEDPGDAYERTLKDRIVREAREAASAWTASAGHGSQVTPRLVIGLCIMLAGFILALDNLGFVDAGSILRYWPLALIAVGITKLVGRTCYRSGAFVWIAVGAALLALNLGRLSFPGVAALLLFLIGARIAWKALSPRPASSVPATAGDLDVVQILGGTKRGLAGSDFKEGQVLVFMGGCEIDLRGASMVKDEAVLDVFAFWGGIEVKIPDDWELVSRGTAVLGGFVDNSRHAAAAKKRLVMTGMAIMGGVEVKN
jgi:predicted membrane protein